MAQHILVGEDEEVSIKEVADAIVKAVGFEGNYTVMQTLDCPVHETHCRYSLIPPGQMDSSVNQPRIKRSCLSWVVSNLHPSTKVSVVPYELIYQLTVTTALDETVQWFLANYDNARTGNKST